MRWVDRCIQGFLLLRLLLRTGQTSWPIETLRNYDSDGWRATGTSKKAIGLMSKTTTLHVHHAFLSMSLLSLHNCHMKWPNFKFTLEQERKVINSTISVWTQAWAQVFTSTLNSLLLSNRMNWDDCKIVSKNVMSIFQRHFHEHHHCQIVRSLIAEWCILCKS